jgi:anti-sigma factor RsiW
LKGMKDTPCRKIRRRLSAYLDGELDAASAKSVAGHLHQCVACRQMVADFRGVDTLVRGLPELDVSPEFAGELLKKATGSVVAPGKRTHSNRRPVGLVLQFMSNFMDLLKERNSPSSRTLEEFGDFPPGSIGSIYMKLLDQPVRG